MQNIENSDTNSITKIFISHLEEWNKERNVITSFKTKGNNVIVRFDKYKFIFTCPDSEHESYIVQAKNRTYNWLDDVNLYCLENKPSINKLLNIMFKQISKIKDEKDTIIKLNNTVNIDRNLGFDIEKYQKQKDLEALIPTCKSIIQSSSSSNVSKKMNQLFGHNVVGKLIVNEFIKLWDSSRAGSSFYKIDIADNNVYHWKIKFNKFNNKDLEKSLQELEAKYGYNYIEMDIYIHDTLYPNYPPIIKVLRPRLMNSLMHKISNIRLLQLDYWIPTRTMSYIINKIYNILDKHAKVLIDTDLNDRTKFNTGSLLPIETHLLDLASLVDIGNSDDIDDEKYEKIFYQKNIDNKTKSNNNSTVWKPGTGYGHKTSVQWDISSYIRSLEERDRNIQKILNKIISEIQESKDLNVVYNTIQYSILINYIKSLLNDVTLLEMRKHISLYQIVFILLINIANDNAIFLFDKLSGSNDKSLYDILTELNSMCLTAQKYYNTNIKTENPDDELIDMILNLYSMVSPCYNNYIKLNNIKKENETKQTNEENIYIKTMTELRDSDDDYKIVNTNYHYQSKFDKDKLTKLPNNILKRINDEILTFKSLQISDNAIIIARHDVNYQTVIRTLITGPENTPYEEGCFLFDTYLHPYFPENPPYVWFLNTGGKRMNPNLYEEGKVCLSILGTWRGDKSESWNPKISTLIQIYKSIQCQILVEQPYFNEPGYECKYNTLDGMKKSKEYNDNIRLYTMNHAMYDLINNPKLYPQFEDVIRAHFKLKKDKILNICNKWTNESPNHMRPFYEEVNAKIKLAIDKL